MELKILKEKVGMTLCLRGNCELLVNGRLLKVERGTLFFRSPVILICEISRDDDFEICSITDTADVFYPVIQPMFATLMRLQMREYPYVRLNEEKINFFIEKQRIIEEKRKLWKQTSNAEEKMFLEKLVKLHEQETLLEFVHHYYSLCCIEPPQEERTASLAMNFIFNVHRWCRKERSVAFYADAANLSVSHFTRLVKAHTGKNPSDWIAIITTIQAQILLKDTDRTIKEIAAELGFPEQFTFRKYFKLHTGMAPRDYRRSQRQEEA
ncbi:MAG: helix-turn-helix domain-containing protein [Alloprevotella sp.]